MKTKLTLRLDDRLIARAKKIARLRGKSLSRMVADYFSTITSAGMDSNEDLPPVTRSLYGSLAGRQVDDSDYRHYLEEKYL